MNDLDELIERLREPFPEMHHDTPREAASEIERLRSKLDKYRSALERIVAYGDEPWAVQKAREALSEEGQEEHGWCGWREAPTDVDNPEREQ